MKLAPIFWAGLASVVVAACTGLDPNPKGSDYEASVKQADEARQAGNFDVAIPLYGRALQTNPQGTEAKLGLGQAYLSIGASDQAAAQFRDVLARRESNIAARRGLATALIGMGQPTLAEEQIVLVLQADSSDYRALNVLGVALDMQGRHAEAQANYRRAIQLAPNYLPTRSNFGLSLAITGPPQEAVAQLAPIATARGSDARIRQNLAFAYVMAGDFENALQISRRDLDEKSAQRQLYYFMQLRAMPVEQRSLEIRRDPNFMPQSGPGT
jgi:Flp pilus assembly protein TadD